MSTTMLPLVLPALFAAAVAAGGHHSGGGHWDPFAGSGCDCDKFCNYECSINASPAANLTLFRMTPFGVLGVGMKDTGDVKGDTSFVISRKTVSYECQQDPSQWFCSAVTQFKGDDPHSTDLIVSYEVEVDGMWGPYLECNPANISSPQGAWTCVPNISPEPAGWPKQCAARGLGGYDNHCIVGTPASVNIVIGESKGSEPSPPAGEVWAHTRGLLRGCWQVPIQLQGGESVL
jgi:hypothetical protein